jgi:hypothetical protein
MYLITSTDYRKERIARLKFRLSMLASSQILSASIIWKLSVTSTIRTNRSHSKMHCLVHIYILINGKNPRYGFSSTQRKGTPELPIAQRSQRKSSNWAVQPKLFKITLIWNNFHLYLRDHHLRSAYRRTWKRFQSVRSGVRKLLLTASNENNASRHEIIKVCMS